MDCKKHNLALDIIYMAMGKGKKPVVLFSGGKDSTAVLHLVRRVCPSTPAMFNNTGVEAKETIEYVRTVPNLIENHPEKSFWECVKEYGYPEYKSKAKSHGNQCCRWLKEKPGDERIKAEGFDIIFTGLTAAESRQRRLTLLRMGDTYLLKADGTWRCHPIWDWTEADVWAYIKGRGIPYNEGYDAGWARCGCVPCSAHKGWEQRLAKENPRMLRHLLKRRYGQRQCGDFID